METDNFIAYCLKKNGAYVDFPFGELPVCIKVRGRVFAQFYTRPDDCKVTLKCEPDFGDFFRQVYPDTVVRGYHCPKVQQPYWNTVYFNGDVPDEVLYDMIDHAYKAVIAKLPKKLQLELVNAQTQ